MAAEEDLVTYPLIQYAAQSWYYHSSLQEDDDVSHKACLLESENSRRAWLLVHQPDSRWKGPFEIIEDAGSSLYYASYTGLERVVVALLDMGADINAQGGQYGNALQASSARGHEKTVKILTAAEVNCEADFPLEAVA